MVMGEIPVVILVNIMLHLPDDAEDAIASLRGAYPFTLNPEESICMNIIVGRRPSPDGGYILDKFPLYYSKYRESTLRFTAGSGDAGSAAAVADTSIWPLLQGYSFRTYALCDLHGSPSRQQLHSLRISKDFSDIVSKYSEHEDCAFVPGYDDTDDERRERIERMIRNLIHFRRNALVLSYDPERSARGVTVLEDEWELLKKQL